MLRLSTSQECQCLVLLEVGKINTFILKGCLQLLQTLLTVFISIKINSMAVTGNKCSIDG